jgi:ubiquinone/menaquinone biosynthesis C-methylase UbiE
MANHRASALVVTLIAALAPVLLAVAEPLAQRSAAAHDSADAAWLVQVLGIKEGSIVGEIGAGDGELTLLLAKTVGPAGRVLSNELNADRVKTIGTAAAAAGLTNVTPVQGAESETKFANQCCDAIFMRAVYHHFNDPPTMNASILKSLKPGGRVAVMDFTPPPTPGSENPPGHRGEDNHHGITAPTLERELRAAGFEIVSSTTEDRAVKVVVRRPT